MTETILTDVGHLIKTHNQSSNLNGESFNIFNILRARRKEVNTHSRFIYELLNPNGSHGEGAIFSSLLVKVLCPDLSHCPDPDDVRREDKTSDGKRIDFTIRSTGNYIIGIEMKVDAADQKKQLFDYNEELLRRKGAHESHRLIYLTLDGKAASERSLGGKDIDYQQVSFKSEIIDWLEMCIQQTKKSELIAAIRQYIRLIESIIGVSRTLSKEISKTIIVSKDSFDASLAIESALIQSKAELQIRFWDEVVKQLEKSGDTVTWFRTKKRKKTTSTYKKLAQNYYQQKKNNKPITLKVDISSMKIGSEEYHFYFYLRLWDAIHYGIAVEDSLGKIIDIPSKSDWQTEYHQSSSFQNAKTARASDWLMSFYNTHGGEAINLHSFNEYAKSILFDAKLLSAEVESIIRHKQEMAHFIKTKSDRENISLSEVSDDF